MSSFTLSTKLISVLREVREHRMEVMDAFEYLTHELTKEFDEVEKNIREEYREFLDSTQE